jgi:dimethylargininase
MFRAAIVRPPASTFAMGITAAGLGPPALELALEQHEAYVRALEACGLQPIRLDPDPRHPDSTFVEDAAVIAPGGALLTRPGAPSRRGEVDSLREALQGVFPRLRAIDPPGTLDGGDVCEAGRHFFIGLSDRTNESGARQLIDFLAEDGCTSALIDIRGMAGVLHLKSGMAALGERRLVAIDVLSGHEAFRGYDVVRVPNEESYAANCVPVNGSLLVAAGFPNMERTLRGLGYSILPLEMSEFRKMDGGLSCLSLRL